MNEKYFMAVSSLAFINDKLEMEKDIFGKEFNNLFEVFDAIIDFENIAEEWLKWVMNNNEISRPTKVWTFKVYDTENFILKATYFFDREKKELTKI